METSDSAVLGNPLSTFYLAALDLLEAHRLPFLVGGSFAYARYTGIDRETKDLDIFVRPEDVPRTLAAFEAAGHRTESLIRIGWPKSGRPSMSSMSSTVPATVWRVDDEWFAHAAESEVLGRRLQLCPLENRLVEGVRAGTRTVRRADVLHLLREAGRDIDWPRLVARFGDYWPVLLSHLVSFHFVYPDHRDSVPSGLIPRWLPARGATEGAA